MEVHLGAPVLEVIEEQNGDGEQHGDGDHQDDHQASVDHLLLLLGILFLNSSQADGEHSCANHLCKDGY